MRAHGHSNGIYFMEPSDNERDEIIDVRLPRRDYEIIRTMIDRERTYTWIGNWCRSGWLWAVVGSAILLVTLWEKIKGMMPQ